jgi:hypothetical protein
VFILTSDLADLDLDGFQVAAVAPESGPERFSLPPGVCLIAGAPGRSCSCGTTCLCPCGPGYPCACSCAVTEPTT